MYEIGNKGFLAGNKFVPEMHLRQPGFTHSGCRSLFFKKTKDRIQTLKKTPKNRTFAIYLSKRTR